MTNLKRLASLALLAFGMLVPALGYSQSCSSVSAVPSTTSSTSGTLRLYAFNVSGAASMTFPTWADAGGQDDLVWYPGTQVPGTNTWYADVNLANHLAGSPQYGTFITHVYINNSILCGNTTWTRTTSPVTASCSGSAPESSSTSQTTGPFRVYAYNVTGASSVTFPTWGASGGQDDLVWYPGTPAGGGTWYADINMANHKPGNPEYGTFHTHVYVNGETGGVLCAAHTFSRVTGTSTYPTITSSSGMSVTLDASRGGQVGSISVPGIGETIVNGDGRGMATSGVTLNEAPDSYLFNESGCPGDFGNRNSSIQNLGSSVIGTATRMVNFAGGGGPVDCPGFPGWDHLANLQIDHKVWFPSSAYKVVAVEETFRNLTGVPLTFRSVTFDGFSWPFAPQIHLNRGPFVNTATNAGYWRRREANGSWQSIAVRQNDPGQWLYFPTPGANFYSVPGHALAVYRDAGFASGVALYCPENDHGFYAADLRGEGIIFISNVWNIGSPLANGASISKTCEVIYGSEAEISARIGGQAEPPPPTKINGITATASSTYPGYDASLAVDNHHGTQWSAGGFPTQWIELDLGYHRNIRKIRLLVSMYPNGETQHYVYAGPNSNPATLVKTFGGYTVSGQWLEADLTGVTGRFVRIMTTASPSWVGWIETEVYE